MVFVGFGDRMNGFRKPFTLSPNLPESLDGDEKLGKLRELFVKFSVFLTLLRTPLRQVPSQTGNSRLIEFSIAFPDNVQMVDFRSIVASFPVIIHPTPQRHSIGRFKRVVAEKYHPLSSWRNTAKVICLLETIRTLIST